MDRNTIRIRPDHTGQTISHIASGVVREGETEDIGWEIVGLLEDIGDTCPEDLCLATPRSGDHENRPIDSIDSFSLTRIEGCEYISEWSHMWGFYSYDDIKNRQKVELDLQKIDPSLSSLYEQTQRYLGSAWHHRTHYCPLSSSADQAVV
jgi:hypothetical protein